MRTSHFFLRSWGCLTFVVLMTTTLAMGAPVARVAMVQEEVFSDDAEAGNGNWDRSDTNADGPAGRKLEYWGVADHQPIIGLHSFYSSQCNKADTVLDLEVCNLNGAGHVYAKSMTAQMMLTDDMAFDLSGYDHGVFSYDYTSQTNDPDEHDFMQHWYNAAPLFAPPVQNGVGGVALKIPSAATKVGFYFVSNDDAPLGHGAYVDNIRVVGSDAKADATLTVVNDPSLEFDGASSDMDVNAAPITSYEWSFGDGQFGSGPLAPHTYENLGTYEIELQITDSLGGQDTAVIFVQVVPEPATLGMLLAVGLVVLLGKRRR